MNKGLLDGTTRPVSTQQGFRTGLQENLLYLTHYHTTKILDRTAGPLACSESCSRMLVVPASSRTVPTNRPRGNFIGQQFLNGMSIFDRKSGMLAGAWLLT